MSGIILASLLLGIINNHNPSRVFAQAKANATSIQIASPFAFDQLKSDLGNLTIWPNIHSNVKTNFNPNVTFPHIRDSAFIHQFAMVIGDCYIGSLVFVAPTAVCRADEGTPIRVGIIQICKMVFSC